MKSKLQPTRVFDWLLIGLITNSSLLLCNYTTEGNNHSIVLYLKTYDIFY